MTTWILCCSYWMYFFMTKKNKKNKSFSILKRVNFFQCLAYKCNSTSVLSFFSWWKVFCESSFQQFPGLLRLSTGKLPRKSLLINTPCDIFLFVYRNCSNGCWPFHGVRVCHLKCNFKQSHACCLPPLSNLYVKPSQLAAGSSYIFTQHALLI